jgi:hypothetical protein
MIKKSEKLNNILQQICDIDFEHVDHINSCVADYYITIECDHEDAVNAVSGGIILLRKSIKKSAPIYEVWCEVDNGQYNVVYFVATEADIKNKLLALLKKARSENV